MLPEEPWKRSVSNPVLRSSSPSMLRRRFPEGYLPSPALRLQALSGGPFLFSRLNRKVCVARILANGLSLVVLKNDFELYPPFFFRH